MTLPILALDPAGSCGWAWTDGSQTESGVWQIGTGDSRLPRLRAKIYRAYRELGFVALAAEDAAQAGRNLTQKLYHADLRGVIKCAAHELGVASVFVNPSSLKLFATGNGRAKKPAMMRACYRHFKINPQTSDEADALWVMAFAQNPPAKSPRPKRKSKPKKGRAAEARLF